MFDVSKSKLYTQIMEAAVAFFGLEKETATEAEVHDALDNVEPLAVQLEKAKEAGGGDPAKVLELEGKVTGIQKQLDDLKTEVATKDTRISELQVELSQAGDKHAKEVEAMKSQHTKEINVLAGQVAALKAGKIQEHDENGGEGISVTKKVGSVEVLTLKDESLIQWAKGKQVAN